MDQYKNFGVEDFVWDTFFRQWILAPTRESDLLWNDWLLENPGSVAFVKEARQVVFSLGIREVELSADEIQDVVGKTIARLNVSSEETNVSFAPYRRFYRTVWFQMAASVLIVMVAGLSFKTYWFKMSTAYRNDRVATDATVVEPEADMIEKVNAGDQHILVQLRDHSKITLAPGSRIRYAKAFTGVKREVFLTGEAFFDIAKDLDRPFLVYANELVTKVLGTSFRVRAYPSSKEVTVEVKTGRVSVFAKSDPELRNKLTRRELEGVILSPNQKIIFEREAVRMVKTLVERPEIVLPKSQIPHFGFEDTPASEAFASIAKAYGIDIMYDEVLLRDCPLTAALDNQPLHEKLSIICKAVEAEYEILDGQVIIHSRGCRN